MIIYYTKEGKFESDLSYTIPFDNLHSPNEETPALIYPDKTKFWFYEGKVHRLSGPAVIHSDGDEQYVLNSNRYPFKAWIGNHPNIDIYLDAQGMNETQKAYWKLKNL